MKRLTVILLYFLVPSLISYAQVPQLQWVKSMGGIYSDYGSCITLDAVGNVYTAGWFSNSVDFDPSIGTNTLTASNYKTDAYISKFDGDGNFIWVKRFGGDSTDLARSIIIDKSGNIYLTGTFQGMVDFDPGPGNFQFTSATENSIFVLKLDSFGNFLWAKSIPHYANNNGYGTYVTHALDRSGNVYVTGSFGTSKFDSVGTLLWIQKKNNIEICVALSITVDNSGNIYRTGYFQGTVDFDPGPGILNLIGKSGGYDIFISKTDSIGNLIWGKTIENSSMPGNYIYNSGYSITVDGSGNVYTSGTFQEFLDFDPGKAVYLLGSAGKSDIFILKLDAAGNFIWAKKMGGPYDDYSLSITLDKTNNVYTSGQFIGSVDFDPGAGIYPLISDYNGGSDRIFVSKLDSDGNFVWATQLTESPNLRGSGTSVVIGESGAVYVTGSFSGIGDFDPGASTSYLASEGQSDIFVIKLKQVPVNVDEPIEATSLTIYPNPSNSFVTIAFGKEIINGRVKLVNILGQIIWENIKINGSSLTVDITGQPTGMYVMELSENGNVSRVRLLKN